LEAVYKVCGFSFWEGEVGFSCPMGGENTNNMEIVPSRKIGLAYP
jgi:hypothetical protein